MVVVVLGNRLRSTEIHDELRGRVDVGVRSFREEDREALVFSGGQSNPDVPRTEAEVMAEYAVEERGVDPDDILLEEDSRDTVGNAYFSRRLIEDEVDTSTIRLVSSCYHVARSVFVFENCFGDAYDVVSPDCYDADTSTAELTEGRSMTLNRRLFAPIEAGDIGEIRDRLIAEHGLYSASDFEAGEES